MRVKSSLLYDMIIRLEMTIMTVTPKLSLFTVGLCLFVPHQMIALIQKNIEISDASLNQPSRSPSPSSKKK